MALVLVIGYSMLAGDKPQWYRDETAVMEQIAALLDSPVAYERGGSGWSGRRHVSCVYLPRVALDEERTRRLADLLRELPLETGVVSYYLWDQPDRMAQLREALRGHAAVYSDVGVSSMDEEERQEETYVAGIHRPGLVTPNRTPSRRPILRFAQRLNMARFRWSTNLEVDLCDLNTLAGQAWDATERWLHPAGGAPPPPEHPLPIFLCENEVELSAVEDTHDLTGSSFRVRPNDGGFYPAGPLVAVIVQPGQAPASVVHEVVHAVIERTLPDCPRPLNEGAAVFWTQRIIGGRNPEWAARWEASHQRICASLDPDHLSLEALFARDYMAFQTRDGRCYELSCELVRVLDRENTGIFPGRLQRLVHALATRGDTDAFKVFRDVYPVRDVEELWVEQVRHAARGD